MKLHWFGIIPILIGTNLATWDTTKRATDRWYQAHPARVVMPSETPLIFPVLTPDEWFGSETKKSAGLSIKGHQLYVAKEGWDIYCIVVDEHPKGSPSGNGVIRPNYETRGCWPSERKPIGQPALQLDLRVESDPNVSGDQDFVLCSMAHDPNQWREMGNVCHSNPAERKPAQ